MNEGKVLARVAGMDITEEEVIQNILAMGQRGEQLMSPEGKQAVLEQLIARKLLLAGARRDLLEFDPVFKKELAVMKDELLTKFAVEKALESVKVTNAEIKAYFDEHQSEMKKGATVKASHILVDTEEKANEIAEEIKSGKVTFADAARKYSKCPSSANGGELGEFGKGQMVPEFEEAAFALDIGTVSSPVKTQFGYHLIIVTEKNESSSIAFDEVKDRIADMLLNDKQQKAYTSKINQLKILFPVDKF